jgi:hypothetical protein
MELKSKAPAFCFDALSSREVALASLESAIERYTIMAKRTHRSSFCFYSSPISFADRVLLFGIAR